jgi:hypothetical protein
MGDDVSGATRSFVMRRAGFRCEYCLLHQDDSFTPHQVDHIVSRKHGGDSSPDNLALACIQCNARKGSDIAGFGREAGQIVPLYHPRRDRWMSHFRLEGGEIVPVTDTAAATVRLLRLNSLGRPTERQMLSKAGRYPREGV